MKPKGEPKLIFNEEFDEFNLDLWEHVNSADGFHTYVNNRTNTFVKDGIFYMQPTLMNETYGNEWLSTGTLNMNQFIDKCTPLTSGCVITVPKEGPEKDKILPVI